MQVRLEVTHRKANVDAVVLRADTLIGRSAECRLRIAANSVSRRHCLITIDGEDVQVRDLGSSNGTRVDGQLLRPHENTPLRPGCVLEVGPVQFVVRFIPSGPLVRYRPPEQDAEESAEPIPDNSIEGRSASGPDDHAPGSATSPVPPESTGDIPESEEPSETEKKPRGLRSLVNFAWWARKPAVRREVHHDEASEPTEDPSASGIVPEPEPPVEEESDAVGLTEGGVVDLLMDNESDDDRREEDTLSARADDPELSDFLDEFDSKNR